MIRDHCTRILTLLLLPGVLTACAGLPDCGGDCRADAGLTQAVRREFRTQVALEVDDITVQTVGQVVYLNGLVDNDRERFDADSLAARVPGVVRVVDKLAVSR
jgi:osmotically-inducible protein OsmY